MLGNDLGLAVGVGLGLGFSIKFTPQRKLETDPKLDLLQSCQVQVDAADPKDI